MSNNCFAAKELTCGALQVTMKDCNPSKCKFYKPKFQNEEEVVNAKLRIGKLDKAHQILIIEKYGMKAVGMKGER